MRHRDRETERDNRDRETERQRQTDRQTETERQTDRERRRRRRRRKDQGLEGLLPSKRTYWLHDSSWEPIRFIGSIFSVHVK